MKNIFTIRDKDESVKRSRGDVGPDGLIFWSYFKDAGKRKGEIRERWLNQNDFDIRKERAMISGSKSYQKALTENPQKLKDRFKSFRDRNKKSEIQRCREWRKNNPQKQREACKRWNDANPDACREHRRKAQKKAIATASLTYFKSRMRHRVREAMKRGQFKKTSSTRDMIGCNWDELRSHIENKFSTGMSWENKSEWEIDHIIPLSSASSEEEIKKLCAWHNLQPLWKADNRSKGDKMPHSA
jgi:hypothetical protein